MHLLGSLKYEHQFSRIRDIQFEDVVSKSTAFIKNHLQRKIVLQEIADHCEVSVSHFCLLFKNNTSHFPLEYLNNLRIQKACQLLDLSALKIFEISEKTGFSDPFYFSKVFKRSIGQSPKEYRKHRSG